MTDRDDALLDAFLEDLGSAPVPPGVASHVRRLLREEQPPRVSRVRGWMLTGAAAVAVIALASLGLLVASPPPTPVQPSALSSAPGLTTAPASPAIPSFGQMPPPGWQPSVAPTIPPTYPPGALASEPSWRVNLRGADAKRPVVAVIVDPGRRVMDAAPASTRLLSAGFISGVLPGSNDHAIAVYWRGTSCDGWVAVALGNLGNQITVVRTPIPEACTGTGYEYGLELAFGQAVDASAFSLSASQVARYTDDPSVFGIAFTSRDATHGLAAMASGTALAADTDDGGATWRLTPIADGWPTGVTRAADADWMAIMCDPSTFDHCAAGVYRRALGASSWSHSLAVDPGPLTAFGQQVAVVEQPLEDHATGVLPPATGIRYSSDSGATWATIANPCPSDTPRLTSVALSMDARLLVVCEGPDGGGFANKALLSLPLPIPGVTDTRPVGLSALPRDGTGAGIAIAFNLIAGINVAQPGFYWATGSPLYRTLDAAGTWTPLRDVADGDVRSVRAAQAWAPGGGMLLVYDRQRGATLLLTSQNGKAWTEVSSFLDHPCCGG